MNNAQEASPMRPLVVMRGAGDLASGIAVRLHRAGFALVMCDLAQPLSIRRTVCFSEALVRSENSITIEGIVGRAVAAPVEAQKLAQTGTIAVMVDPEAACIEQLQPTIVVDAILAKRNLGTTKAMAPLVIGVGPGFTAPLDCHAAVETMRGHYLGQVYYEGSPLPNTAIPGLIGGFAGERVVRASADGVFEPCVALGEQVVAGQAVASVAGVPVIAHIDGVLRGLLAAGVVVTCGLKVGDVDPRGDASYLETVSDKARAIGGGVLEAIMHLSCGFGSSFAPIVPAAMSLEVTHEWRYLCR